MKRRYWTGLDVEFLRLTYADHTTRSIATVLGRPLNQVYRKAAAMNLVKSPEYLASELSHRLRLGSEIGKPYRFKPGHVPTNKGLRRPGYAPGRMAETQFKKGRPAKAARNYVPIGTERISKDGTLERKVTDDPALVPARRWESVARLVWAAAHGPIPPKHVVRFLPGQATTVAADITVARLECISMAENARRNSIHRYPKEIALAMQMRGALNRRINREQKEHQ